MPLDVPNSLAFICALFAFASMSFFASVLVLVGTRSKLRATEHRIIFLLILNFFFYSFEETWGFGLYLFADVFVQRIFLVSWFGFGSFIFLYIFYSVYPKQISRKYRFVNLLFLFPAVEYLMHLPDNLHFWGLLTDESIFVKAYQLFDSFSTNYSLLYALFLLIGAIFLMTYQHFFRRFELIHQVSRTWLWGILLFSFVLITLDNFGGTKFYLAYYLTLLLLSIYILFFVFYCPQAFSGKRSSFNDRMREVFTAKAPTILMDQNYLMIHLNEQMLKILNYRKSELLGRSVARLLPAAAETPPKDKTEVEFDLITKSNMLLSGRFRQETLQVDYPSESVFHSIQLLEYHELGQFLSQEDELLMTRLEQLMEEQQLFLNPVLQQTDIAEALQVSKRRLGELLKSRMNTTFPSFVNTYRVTYAQSILKDGNKHHTIEAIGRQAGFSSKTSFFTIFKEITGQTPGQYRKQ
ncbi:MAG: helix-turn-helix transcriptional regulator [Saprospiraceae bacterium]|nr:helix-turn-helix transcriptional regulator [Saprospiraceae bacterium]